MNVAPARGPSRPRGRSELVGLPCQPVREVLYDLGRLVLAQPSGHDEIGQEGRIDPPAMSWRAGIDVKARVSSLKPTVL